MVRSTENYIVQVQVPCNGHTPSIILEYSVAEDRSHIHMHMTDHRSPLYLESYTV